MQVSHCFTFFFSVYPGNVIKAWDIGVASMKKGEKAILTCASEYAYGASGSPPTIPPNATLEFEVSFARIQTKHNFY